MKDNILKKQQHISEDVEQMLGLLDNTLQHERLCLQSVFLQ